VGLRKSLAARNVVLLDCAPLGVPMLNCGATAIAASPAVLLTFGVCASHMHQISARVCQRSLNLWYHVATACWTLVQRQLLSLNPCIHG